MSSGCVFSVEFWILIFVCTANEQIRKSFLLGSDLEIWNVFIVCFFFLLSMMFYLCPQ